MDTQIRGLLNGTNLLYEWTGLEKSPSLIDGGGADTGGINSLPHGSHTWSPSTQNQSGLLTSNPVKRHPGKPWDNLYVYNTLTKTPAQLTYLCLEFSFAVPSSSIHGNAREFEIELCESGWTYNMAWQFKWSNVDGPPAWRMFDQIESHWVTPSESLPTPDPQPDKFIDVQAFFVIDRPNGVTIHDSLTTDGVNYPIGIAHKKKQKWNPSVNYLHYATQIDSLGDGVSCSTRIKNWNVRGF